MATVIFNGDPIHAVTGTDKKVTGFDGSSLGINFHNGTGRTTLGSGNGLSPHLNTPQTSTVFDNTHDVLRAGDKLQLHTAASDGESYDAEIIAIDASGSRLVIDDIKDALTFAGVSPVNTGIVADGTNIARINFSSVDSNEPPADLTGDEVVDMVITFIPPGFDAGYTESETILNQPGFERIEYSTTNDRVVVYFAGANATAHRDAFIARFDGSTQAQGGASQGTDIDVTLHYHDNDAITHYSYAKNINFNREGADLDGEFISTGIGTNTIILTA